MILISSTFSCVQVVQEEGLSEGIIPHPLKTIDSKETTAEQTETKQPNDKSGREEATSEVEQFAQNVDIEDSMCAADQNAPNWSEVTEAEEKSDLSKSTDLEIVPNLDEPNLNVPNQEDSVPNAKVPNIAVPSQAVPNIALPNQAVPNQESVPNVKVPNIAVPNQSVPNWLHANTLATSATLELAKFFALQNLRDDWNDDEGDGEMGLLQNRAQEKDVERNFENISELGVSLKDYEEVAKDDKEKEVVIPTITEEKKETNLNVEEVDDFLDASVDELLKGLSDDEDDDEKEPSYDESDGWDYFDNSSPQENIKSLSEVMYISPGLNEMEEENEKLLQSRVFEANEILEESNHVLTDGEDQSDHQIDEHDPFNETSTSEEMLKEISDNMTVELLNLFGTEKPSPEEATAVVVKNPKMGKKRLLPLWMRVGDSGLKHFKVGPTFEKLTLEEAGITVGGHNFEFWSSCDMCTFMEPNKKNLMKHRKVAHPNEQFICKLCGKRYKAYLSLVQHIQTVHMKHQRYKSVNDISI